MKLTVLGSGSRGNSVAMWHDDEDGQRVGILIDAGLSHRQMKLRLEERGLNPGDFGDILVTHAHKDHQQAIKMWIEKYGARVWCTRPTARRLEALQDYPSRWRQVKTDRLMDIYCGWQAQAHYTDHQAEGCVTYHVLSPDLVKVGCFLETGKVTREMWQGAKGLDACILETNHDHKALAQNETRPDFVNERAADGHLSNRQARDVVEYLPASVQAVVCVHLSGDCNQPEWVEAALTPVLKSQTKLIISTQETPTPIVTVVHRVHKQGNDNAEAT